MARGNASGRSAVHYLRVEFTLKFGDGLRQKIDAGLVNSDYLQ